MRRTTWLAVALNLGVAVAAWLLSAAERGGGQAPTGETAPEEAEAPAHERLAVRAVLAGTGLSGFCALAYELLWTRMLNLFLNNNVYSFTAVLATFLPALPSEASILEPARGWRPVLVRGLQLDRRGPGRLLFGLLQGALFSRQSDALTLAKTAVVAVVPTVLMGIALPSRRICRRGPRLDGTTVGTVYAVNTVGSILGSFAAGFILVPHVGLHHALSIVVGLNLLGAFLAAVSVAAPRSRPVWAVGFTVVAATAVFGAPRTLFCDLYERAQPSAGILLYEEGRVANVVVYDFHKSGYKDLYLNAIEEASSRLWHVQLFKMLGILPVMVHDHAGRALMIAFGAGMSAGATAGHVASLDVVDLNPDVAGRAVFAHENSTSPPSAAPRRERRPELAPPGPERYSVIISDATNPRPSTRGPSTRGSSTNQRSRWSRAGSSASGCGPLARGRGQVLLVTFRQVFPTRASGASTARRSA
jgi:spermidine synthase